MLVMRKPSNGKAATLSHGRDVQATRPRILGALGVRLPLRDLLKSSCYAGYRLQELIS
jgi:hypothetical protein